MHQALEVISVSSHHASGRYHNIHLIIRRRPPTAAEAEELGRQLQQAVARFPVGHVLVQQTLPPETARFSFPGDDVRQRIAQFTGLLKDKLLLLAVVPPSNAIVRAATRSFLLGAKLLGRLKTPIEVFADTNTAVVRACQVAQSHIQTRLDPQEAIGCLAQLRGLLDSHGSAPVNAP